MVTGIPYSNYECLQLLKYEVGQFYLEHDDHIEYHTKQSHGPRLLTFFIYFNEVEKGGATRFPKLDLTVQAKKGRVLIWPSITDDGTWKTEFRTSHEAMAVEQGQKFAANAWIHMRDFQTPFAKGCPG
jgi:prolyl 4-hydroxylase